MVWFCCALLHPPRLDFLHLRKVQSRGLFAQDQFGTLALPLRITPARLEVATQFDGIVVPCPNSSRVDLEAGEAGVWASAQVRRVQVQAERLVVEGRMIAGSWAPRLPLFLAGCAPRPPIRWKGGRPAKCHLDHMPGVA